MLFPEPESPLTSTSCTTSPAFASLVLLHLLALPREKLGGGVDAAQLEDFVAHRGFDQHGEIAPRGYRDGDLAHRDAQDLLRLRGERQTLGGIAGAGLRALEMREQAQL